MARLTLSLGAVTRLAEGQESERASGEARGGGGLGALIIALPSATATHRDLTF